MTTILQLQESDFDLNVPEIQAFNHYLRVMQSQNIIAVQIILD